MTVNNAIMCKVGSCKYHDSSDYCTRQGIVVGKDCECAENCCETECLSFETM